MNWITVEPNLWQLDNGDDDNCYWIQENQLGIWEAHRNEDELGQAASMKEAKAIAEDHAKQHTLYYFEGGK